MDSTTARGSFSNANRHMQEEEELVPIVVEFARSPDGTTDVVSHLHEPVNLAG